MNLPRSGGRNIPTAVNTQQTLAGSAGILIAMRPVPVELQDRCSARGCQVRRASLLVDITDECGERETPFRCDFFKCLPEFRLESDTRAMSCKGKRPLGVHWSPSSPL